MDFGAAKLLGRHGIPGRGLNKRRPAQKDRAVALHDDALVAHGGNIGAARGARPHDERDLRNARRRHLRLVVEYAAEMALVRENLVLLRKESAARVHKVKARQAVIPGDVLGARDVFLRSADNRCRP